MDWPPPLGLYWNSCRPLMGDCLLAKHVFQTRDLHDGTLGIGSVNGLAGMPQGGLSEPLRHPLSQFDQAAQRLPANKLSF
jgi:hypothetical protein